MADPETRLGGGGGGGHGIRELHNKLFFLLSLVVNHLKEAELPKISTFL